MEFPNEVMQFIQIGHGPHPDKYICRDQSNRIWVLNNLEFLTTMSKPHKETAEFRSIDPNSFATASTVHYFLKVFDIPHCLNGSFALHPIFNLLWDVISKVNVTD